MPSIELDASRFPLVVATFDAHQTYEEMERYLAAFDRVHARRQEFALMAVIKRYVSDRKQVDLMGTWMKRNEDISRRYCVCTAMVTASLGFRFLLSTVLLVKPLVMPYRVCRTVDEGLDFVRAECTKRNVVLPRDLG
jgi:hypothetical protein